MGPLDADGNCQARAGRKGTIGGQDAFDTLFGQVYDKQAADFTGTQREVCRALWEEYRTFSNPQLNPKASEELNAAEKLKMEAKQLAPYDLYIEDHGLTWPVREVDGATGRPPCGASATGPKRTASIKAWGWLSTANRTRRPV